MRNIADIICKVAKPAIAGGAGLASSEISSKQITGARRMSLRMLEVVNRADQFTGLPRGTAKPLRFLGAFQEAEPYLGLPPQAFKIVSWLVKWTQPQDWEEGSRPIAWPSARRQAEFLGLSPARVKSINRILFEAGMFVIRDNEQCKRYGRRGPDGRIVEAFGFDLSPLAQRYDEFIRLAAEAGVERDRKKSDRRRVTLARRGIRQIGELFAELGVVPKGWVSMEADTAALVRAGKQAERSDELALIATSLERRKAEAEQWLKEATSASKPVEMSPKRLENEPHTITTNLTLNATLHTVIAVEESGQGGIAAPPCQPSQPVVQPSAEELTTEREFRLNVAQLLDLAPRLAACVFTETPTWPAIVDTAGGQLRTELGISASLWGAACQAMGRKSAAVALAIVSTKPAEHFTSSAGGYFAGMVRKAERGELHLERTLWALKDRKWGTMKCRSAGGKVPSHASGYRGGGH